MRAFEHSRKSFPTGRIEWSVLPEGDPDKALNFVSRYAANGDMIFENRGDNEGWTLFDPQSGEGRSRYPQLYMVNADGYWLHQETTLNCMWWSDKAKDNHVREKLRDLRALGAYVTSSSLNYDEGPAKLCGNPTDPVTEWSQEAVDEILIVTGRTASDVTIRWYINPERGWNAERVEYDTGFGMWEAVSSLANYDGTWFPEDTRYYENGRLVEAVVIRSAALNRTDDKEKFTLHDLGVEHGSSISAQDLPSKSGPELRTWGGEGIMPFEQWASEIRSGKRTLGPIRQSMKDKGRFESIYDTPGDVAARQMAIREARVKHAMSRHVGLWEQYVRDFIARYKLNDEQTQKAWAIFLECRRRGDDLIARDKAKMTELVSRSLAAKDAGDTKKQEKLDQELGKLRAPVDRIFEESLKPRLDKLPTRAQRQAAESAASDSGQAAPAKP